MASANYLQAGVPPLPPRPPLEGHVRADVCVVGGGLTGLSAALALAEGGASVVLLEGKRVGCGASGRSGGQIIPGFRHGAVELVRTVGRERARRLVGMTARARETLQHLQDIDWKPTGHVTAAIRPRDLAAMAAEARCSAEILDRPNMTVVDAAGLAAHVGSDAYCGGLVDGDGGHVHPLKLAGALAIKAERAGVSIHEDSPVATVSPDREPTVRTDIGEVTAGAVILACDAAIGSIRIGGRTAAMERRLMPVLSYSVATAPLTREQARAILPTDAAVSDTRFALDYFRLSADRRLLFSGGERYTLRPLADIAGLVRPRLAATFPALAEVPIPYAWDGIVGVTTSRFPQVGRDGPIWFAHGYSGHGLLLAQAAGRAIGQAIGGDIDDFRLLSDLPTRDWPGGTWFRGALYTAGMLCFGWKDRW